MKGEHLLMENALFYTEIITDHITRIVLPGEVFAYLIEGSERAVLIDTGCGIGDLKSYVESLTDKPCVVLLSHGHLDHAPGAVQFDKVYMSRLDADMLSIHSDPARRFGFAKGTDGAKNYTMDDVLPSENADRYHDLNDGDTFDLGGYTIEVLSCPGHTQGSMAFLFVEDRILLTGDACNPFTFIFGPAALSLSGYERSLLAVKAKTEGRYDRMLVSHGIGEVVSDTLIEENLQNIADIRAGNVDNIPFAFGASDTLRIAKKHPRMNECGRIMANIVYDPSRADE